MSGNKATIAKIGKHIAELRKEKGYTQRTLSEMVYVGEKTVSKWERGIVAPDIAMIKTLSNIFEVSVDELLSGEKIENNNENCTVNAINAYTYQAKHKLLKHIFIIICILFLLFTIVTIIINNYKWKVNYYNINDEFQISGYSFQNNIETKIIINRIIYDDPNAGTSDEISVDSLKISLYSNDEEICSNQNNYSVKASLSHIFNNYYFVCESEKKIDLKNLSIVFSYYLNDKKVNKKLSLIKK